MILLCRGQRTAAAAKTDVLQGTLDLMVLQALASMGPLHGYGIARRIEQISDDLLKLNEGTVYASLMRLQHAALDLGDLGRVREQPQGEVLRHHRRRPPSTGARDRELGAHLRRHRAPAAHLRERPRWPRVLRPGLLKWLWRRRRVDDETRAEIEAHLELLTERYIRSGMTPDEARATAARGSSATSPGIARRST